MKQIQVEPEQSPVERGGMSIREAGRRGGEKVLGLYGREFYSEIGKKGGEAMVKKYGLGFYSDIGKKGGAMMRGKYGKVFYSKIGKLGEAATAKIKSDLQERKVNDSQV